MRKWSTCAAVVASPTIEPPRQVPHELLNRILVIGYKVLVSKFSQSHTTLAGWGLPLQSSLRPSQALNCDMHCCRRVVHE